MFAAYADKDMSSASKLTEASDKEEAPKDKDLAEDSPLLTTYELGGYKWSIPNGVSLKQCTWLWVRPLGQFGI